MMKNIPKMCNGFQVGTSGRQGQQHIHGDISTARMDVILLKLKQSPPLGANDSAIKANEVSPDVKCDPSPHHRMPYHHTHSKRKHWSFWFLLQENDFWDQPIRGNYRPYVRQILCSRHRVTCEEDLKKSRKVMRLLSQQLFWALVHNHVSSHCPLFASHDTTMTFDNAHVHCPHVYLHHIFDTWFPCACFIAVFSHTDAVVCLHCW